MAETNTTIELARFSRPMGLLRPWNRGGSTGPMPERASLGLLRPFDGVLGSWRPSHGGVPPVLSFLRLLPLVREDGANDTADRSPLLPGDTNAEMPTVSGDDGETTVADDGPTKVYQVLRQGQQQHAAPSRARTDARPGEGRSTEADAPDAGIEVTGGREGPSVPFNLPHLRTTLREIETVVRPYAGRTESDTGGGRIDGRNPDAPRRGPGEFFELPRLDGDGTAESDGVEGSTEPSGATRAPARPLASSIRLTADRVIGRRSHRVRGATADTPPGQRSDGVPDGTPRAPEASPTTDGSERVGVLHPGGSGEPTRPERTASVRADAADVRDSRTGAPSSGAFPADDDRPPVLTYRTAAPVSSAGAGTAPAAGGDGTAFEGRTTPPPAVDERNHGTDASGSTSLATPSGTRGTGDATPASATATGPSEPGAAPEPVTSIESLLGETGVDALYRGFERRLRIERERRGF